MTEEKINDFTNLYLETTKDEKALKLLEALEYTLKMDRKIILIASFDDKNKNEGKITSLTTGVSPELMTKVFSSIVVECMLNGVKYE